MNNKKLDEVTKIKLIYSGEILIFAIIFALIGILDVTGVKEIKDWVLNVFKVIALLGGAYFIYDFVTTFTNKKKREKACLVDKFSTIFIPPYTITLAIMLWANNAFVIENRRYFIGFLLIAISVVYLFQAIYHWFFPLKELLEDEENEKETAKQDLSASQDVDFDFTKEENKPEENNEKDS